MRGFNFIQGISDIQYLVYDSQLRSFEKKIMLLNFKKKNISQATLESNSATVTKYLIFIAKFCVLTT